MLMEERLRYVWYIHTENGYHQEMADGTLDVDDLVCITKKEKKRKTGRE